MKLGYLDVEPTGYYGDATITAVKKVQKDYGCDADGIAGSTTLSLIDRLLGKSTTTTAKSNSSSTGALKEGVEGSSVSALQKNLVKLGYLNADPTGYFGTLTVKAVTKLQKANGYTADGVVGSNTLALISKLVVAKTSTTATAKTTTTTAVSASKTSEAKDTSEDVNYKLPWFNNAEDVLAKGTTANVYDIESGLSFKIKRTYGHNHADCETLTSKDTATMKKIYGGEWSWARRAVIVTVGDTKIAASMAGMPHAGSDKYSANKYVSSRSGGYGRGQNLDAVKGNGMSGVFDLHFYKSKTHNSNKVDSKHQSMINTAVEWAKKNL